MSSFTVQSATLKKELPDAKYGPAKVIELHLDNGGSDVPLVADWFTKASTPVPEVGARLEGDVKPAQFGGGWDFKKASGGAFAVSSRGRSPEERRAIAMQASHKVAVDIARLALDGVTANMTSMDITAVVKTIAQALFDQIEEVTA